MTGRTLLKLEKLGSVITRRSKPHIARWFDILELPIPRIVGTESTERCTWTVAQHAVIASS